MDGPSTMSKGGAAEQRGSLNWSWPTGLIQFLPDPRGLTGTKSAKKFHRLLIPQGGRNDIQGSSDSMRVRLRSLDQQVVVITGASSGIGLVTARQAADRGAKLVLAARNE